MIVLILLTTAAAKDNPRGNSNSVNTCADQENILDNITFNDGLSSGNTLSNVSINSLTVNNLTVNNLTVSNGQNAGSTVNGQTSITAIRHHSSSSSNTVDNESSNFCKFL